MMRSTYEFSLDNSHHTNGHSSQCSNSIGDNVKIVLLFVSTQLSVCFGDRSHIDIGCKQVIKFWFDTILDNLFFVYISFIFQLPVKFV